MALTKTQVSELYVAIFNRASEGEGNQYWQGLDGSAAEIAALMLATPAAQAYFGDSLDSDQAFIEHIYLNTLGKTYADDAEGIDYWVGRLEAGEDRGALIAELVVAAQHPDFAGTDAQQQFLNRVEVSDYTADTLFNAPADFATSLGFDGDLVVTENPGTINGAKDAVDAIADDQPGEPGEPGEEGQRIRLTEGRDDVTGTSGDDTFVGYVGQNQNGTIVNEFSTGDFIDGGAGRDKVEASIQADLQADSGQWAIVNPRTNNVEEVHLEALSVSGSEAIGGAGIVQVDAGRMDSVQEFWSDNSSAHLQIEDIRLGSKLNITKDVTFGLRETDFGTDFTALFDSQSLVNAPAQQVNSALSIRIADVSTETPDAPLTNVNLNLSFNLGGETVTLENVQANGGTYLGLVTAIRTALAEAGHPELNVGVGAQYNQVTFAGNTVTLPFTASEVLITDPNGNAFTGINFTQSAIAPVQGGFLVAGNAAPVDPAAVSNLIESNLILDNAGRGSTAGDVVIGGMSNSNGGVQKFNVTVEGARQSKIESLNTTNNRLLEIEIDSAEGSTASLAIGRTQAGLREIDANGFTGANLALGTGATDAAAIENLLFLDAGETGANVSFTGANAFTGASNQKANLLTGSGNDVITLTQSGISASGSTVTQSEINTGAGNDVVTLIQTGAVQTTSTVITGAGNDVVNGGGVSVIVSAGEGDDVVYAENTGIKALANIDVTTAGFTLATPATDTTPHTDGNVHLLAGKQLQVTLSVGDATYTAAAAALDTGFESKVVTISASNGPLTSYADVTRAIIEAINTDPVLSKLAKASVDSNGQLTVQYLVDGVQAVGAIAVDVFNPTPAQPVSTAAAQAYRDLVNNSSLTVAAIQAVADSAAPATIASDFAHVATEIQLAGTIAIGDIITVVVDGKVIEVVSTGADLITASNDIAAALTAEGFIAAGDGADTVALINSGLPTVTVSDNGAGALTATVTNQQPVTEADIPALLGTASPTAGVNVVNGGAGNDVIVLSSEAATADTVVYTGYNQGNDTIVHFESGLDQLDFTSYLTGTVPGSGSSSTSAESEVGYTVTVVAGETFTANSVNLINFTDLGQMATGVSFASMTVAQVQAALNADTNNAITAVTGLYQTNAKSVLIVHNDEATVGNDGVYTAYEVTYANDAAANNAFTVQLIGTFDLGDDVLAVGDIVA